MILSQPEFNGPAKQRRSSAFSLVEMVLALGVASFAMIALLGLIPLGLKTSKEAIDATIQSQMMQTICNQIQLSSFEDVDSWNGKKFYFDDQGLAVESAASPSLIYTAELQVLAVDVTDAALPPTIARTIQIRIAGKSAESQGASTFNLIVANTGS